MLKGAFLVPSLVLLCLLIYSHSCLAAAGAHAASSTSTGALPASDAVGQELHTGHHGAQAGHAHRVLTRGENSPLNQAQRWAAQLAGFAHPWLSPWSHGGTVFTAGWWNGSVQAWSAATGELLWEHSTGPPSSVMSTPVVSEGRLHVVIGGSEAHLVALDMEGVGLWRAPSRQAAWGGKGSLCGDVWLAGGTHTGTGFALSSSTGVVRWTVPLGTWAFGGTACSTDGHTAYQIGDSGRPVIVATDTNTGKSLWTADIELGTRTSHGICHVGTPAGDLVLALNSAALLPLAKTGPSIQALSASSGAVQWRFDVQTALGGVLGEPGGSAADLHGLLCLSPGGAVPESGIVLVTMAPYRLAALSAATGQLLWSRELGPLGDDSVPAASLLQPPAVDTTQGFIYSRCDGPLSLCQLDLLSGRLLATLPDLTSLLPHSEAQGGQYLTSPHLSQDSTMLYVTLSHTGASLTGPANAAHTLWGINCCLQINPQHRGRLLAVPVTAAFPPAPPHTPSTLPPPSPAVSTPPPAAPSPPTSPNYSPESHVPAPQRPAATAVGHYVELQWRAQLTGGSSSSNSSPPVPVEVAPVLVGSRLVASTPGAVHLLDRASGRLLRTVPVNSSSACQAGPVSVQTSQGSVLVLGCGTLGVIINPDQGVLLRAYELPVRPSSDLLPAASLLWGTGWEMAGGRHPVQYSWNPTHPTDYLPKVIASRLGQSSGGGSVALAGTVIMAGAQGLTAVDSVTGAPLWSSGPAPLSPTSSSICTNSQHGLVYYSTDDPATGVVALRVSDGSEAWRSAGPWMLGSGVRCSAERVFVANSSLGRLCALSAGTGTSHWCTSFSPGPLNWPATLVGDTSPGLVLITSGTGDAVHVLEEVSGQLLTHIIVPAPAASHKRHLQQQQGPISTPPVILPSQVGGDCSSSGRDGSSSSGQAAATAGEMRSCRTPVVLGTQDGSLVLQVLDVSARLAASDATRQPPQLLTAEGSPPGSGSSSPPAGSATAISPGQRDVDRSVASNAGVIAGAVVGGSALLLVLVALLARWVRRYRSFNVGKWQDSWNHLVSLPSMTLVQHGSGTDLPRVMIQLDDLATSALRNQPVGMHLGSEHNGRSLPWPGTPGRRSILSTGGPAAAAAAGARADDAPLHGFSRFRSSNPGAAPAVPLDQHQQPKYRSSSTSGADLDTLPVGLQWRASANGGPLARSAEPWDCCTASCVLPQVLLELYHDSNSHKK